MSNRDIPNKAITASSYWDGNTKHPTFYARLHWTKFEIGHGWVAATQNTNQWLQVDFSRVLFVTAIATQGRHIKAQRVTSYSLSYSNDGTAGTEYKENGTKKVR